MRIFVVLAMMAGWALGQDVSVVLVPGSIQPSLDDRVTARLAGFAGRVSIHAKNLKTGAEYDREGGRLVKTASSIKLPILIGVYTAVAEGQAKWGETSALSKENKVSGSGVLQELSDGTSLNLKDLVRLMILLSDNTATNLVLDHVSGNAINASMAKLGLKNTRSLRKILSKDNLPHGLSDAFSEARFKDFGIGVATPREFVSLLERLDNGELVSKEASGEMLDLMKKQSGREGMPRRFAGVAVANKPGALDRFRGDVGIVYSDGGPVAIAIACEDLGTVDWTADAPAYLAIADLSGLIVDGLSKK